jgi:cyclopropane-fatty-acyl-phospholipid synthase
MLDSFLRSFFKQGSAVFHLPGGQTVICGDPGAPEVVVRLHKLSTGLEIARRPALALGEAYMDQTLEIEHGDIYGLFDLIARNRGNQFKPRPSLWRDLVRMFLSSNDRGAARQNVAHHYDLSVDFYRLFLDEDLQYSCAYFPRPDLTLEEAQVAKKQHLLSKLRLEPDMRVLDIGCGWGGLGLTLAEEMQALVTGVTLSTEQQGLATQRAVARGLSDRAEFRLQDYRDVAGRFDRIISVGMFEHVGAADFPAFFDAIARLLDDDGVAVLHSIGRKSGPGPNQRWINKYIFPGGYVPALSEVLPIIERSGLWVTDIEILRLHYAETLRHWRQRFQANRDKVEQMYDSRFCRMWEFYLALSEMSFRYVGYMVFQIQLTKRVDATPLTRDYMVDFERRRAQAAGGGPNRVPRTARAAAG